MNDDKQSKRILLDLTSAKNDDVYQKIIKRDKGNYNKVIDYICDAIRAFDEQGKNKKNNNIDLYQIKNLVDTIVTEKLKDITTPVIEEEKDLKNLEDDIGVDVNVEDD